MDQALIAAAIASAPDAKTGEAEDPNAGASNAASAPAVDTASSAANASNGPTGSTTSASSGIDAPPLHTQVAAHLESIFQMVFDKHKANNAAREHAHALLQRVESAEQPAWHEMADGLRQLIAML